MDKFFTHHYTIRHNLMPLIGVCLCFYFAYHMLHGERSITRLISLSHSIETMSQEYDILYTERSTLENRVAMLRPGSINRDLLEEQARLVLGYKNEDEIIILTH